MSVHTAYLNKYKPREWVEAQLDMLFPGQRLIIEVTNRMAIRGMMLTKMRKPPCAELNRVLSLIGYTALEIKKAKTWLLKAELIMTWLRHESIHRPQQPAIHNIMSNVAVSTWSKRARV
jgi:hypothetical protein